MENNTNSDVVCFGEILWDILPSTKTPGGAPMNVAYHLKKLGHEPKLITKVGVDDWGKKLFDTMEEHNICTDYFQVDYHLETGKVYAAIQEGIEVSYDIVKPVAWDNILWDDEFDSLVPSAKIFVFGSLAARSVASRSTLCRLLEKATFKVLDLNLRSPHYNRNIIEQLMKNLDLLKLNQEELELITGWFTKEQSLEDRVTILQETFRIPVIVVTRGSRGALLKVKGHFFTHSGYEVNVADTIGSGDAFLAGLIAKLLHQASPPEMLDFACAMGAMVAGYNGACPDYSLPDVERFINSKKQIKTVE